MQRIRKNPKLAALSAALFALGLLLILGWKANNWYLALLLSEQRAETREYVSLRGNALSAAVSRRFALIDGLGAFVETEFSSSNLDSKFDIFAAGLFESTPGLRIIALAPEGIVRLVYPLNDNKDLIGYMPSDSEDSRIQVDTQRAVDSREILMSGPVELEDGDAGLVIYQAVYIDENYWGLAIIELDIQPILSRAGLDSLGDEIQYTLGNSDQEILWGDADIFNNNPVIHRIELAETMWDLAALPENGWYDAVRRDLTIFQTAFFIIILLVVLITYLAVSNQVRLTRVIDDRTRELSHSKILLESRVEERTKELSALLEVARTVSSTLEIEPLLGLILSQLRRVIDYSGAAVAVLEDGNLVFLDYQGPDPREQILGLKIPLDEPSGYQEVINRRETVIHADLWSGSSGEKSNNSAGEDNRTKIHFKYARSWMGIPLIVKGRIIGVLRIDHVEPDRFSLQDATLVQAFANQAAAAIENARLYQQAHDLASLKERQRIARDLHDSVSQALYGISLGAQSTRKILEQKPYTPELLNEPLDYLVSLSGAALAEMRALIFELRPEALEKEGLVVLLEQHASAIMSRHKIKVETYFIEEPAVAVETKEALFRVTQEAVNNAVKHARASTLEISLRTYEEFLVLEVRDNGQGFNPKEDYPGRIGLSTMRERIEARGGTLEITSEPRKGTLVRAAIPYPGDNR